VRILDLFCGAGGVAMGYHYAFPDAEIVGVDIAPQPRYPFTFVQADAMTYPLEGFEFVHASPPCQGYTTMNNRWGSASPLLIAAVRRRLIAAAVPYVIENVAGARRQMINPVELTGEMFGLGVYRPRWFESSWLILVPARPPQQIDPVAVYGKQDGRRLFTRADGTELHVANLATAAAAMDIDWMTWDEIREAVPPAYTEHIGRQLAAVLA
jgi:DNA (cytosine-5)-methyltransferase 1